MFNFFSKPDPKGNTNLITKNHQFNLFQRNSGKWTDNYVKWGEIWKGIVENSTEKKRNW